MRGGLIQTQPPFLRLSHGIGVRPELITAFMLTEGDRIAVYVNEGAKEVSTYRLHLANLTPEARMYFGLETLQ